MSDEQLPLTEPESNALAKLREYMRHNRRPPTNVEGAQLIGCASPRAWAYHIEALERKGYVVRGEGHRNLSIVGVAGRLTLKVYGEVACGEPMPCDDGEPDEIDLEQLFDPDTITLLKARGESMIDAHIKPGDLVAVRKGQSAKNGDTVVARVGGDITLKKLVRRRSEGAYEEWLHPCNAKMKPFLLNPDNGDEILGVYAGVIRVPKKGCC
ncbi:LexA repressor [Gemmata sp. SH-PL17]|uniref:transcriptional repressor LexA n=1 Tax=Gemmata sp. SH-PL17 TaxID=1630693 RepID=UPI00078EA9AD|nr:transcriptional repressor LexA [Gemmata sp. SH-PL17]AMV24640.1 LexA repressor [Gemmata sp. SH-PL17]